MSLEDNLLAEGLWPLCGVDEAGRGPLAGPVVAAAVILKPDSDLRKLVRDSKKLSHARREKLHALIMAEASVCVAFVSPEEIDRINILNAAMLAMRQAVEQLDAKPRVTLIDGNRTPAGMDGDVRAVVKGDQSEASISAASIIAKVERDRYMLEIDSRYPEYGFARHKGYPTADHYAALNKLGPTPIHRRTFKGVLV